MEVLFPTPEGLFAGWLLFLSLLVGVQAWYFLAYFLRVGQYRAPGANPKPAPVSLVVCVRRNLSQIQALLDSLLAQEYPEFEVVVVDDRTPDEIYDFFLDIKGRTQRLRYCRIHEAPDGMNEKKFALSIGIKAARYPVVLLTDDDCLPTSPHWLQMMAESLTAEKEIVLGYSPYRRYSGLLNGLIRFETFFAGVQYLGQALAGKPYMGVGRNLLYTRSLFFRNHGFYKHMKITGGDDDLFINRTATAQNTAVCLNPQAQTPSEPKHRWRDWYQQKRRHYSVSKYYNSATKTRLGIWAAAYVLFWVAWPLTFLWPEAWSWALAVWLVRQILAGTVYYLAARRLGERFNVLALLGLEWLYAYIFSFFSLAGLRAKKVGWHM